MKSKHYDLKKLYYQHLAENPDYPEWQDWIVTDNQIKHRTRLNSPPRWDEVLDYKYDPLPRIILVNGIEVPGPEKILPFLGAIYYFPSLLSDNLILKASVTRESPVDKRVLELGYMHLSEENAIIHAKALFGVKE